MWLCHYATLAIAGYLRGVAPQDGAADPKCWHSKPAAPSLVHGFGTKIISTSRACLLAAGDGDGRAVHVFREVVGKKLAGALASGFEPADGDRHGSSGV